MRKPSQTIIKNLGVGDQRVRDLQKTLQEVVKQLKEAQSGISVRQPFVWLTREEYEALDAPDPDIVYVIYTEEEDESTSSPSHAPASTSSDDPDDNDSDDTDDNNDSDPEEST